LLVKLNDINESRANLTLSYIEKKEVVKMPEEEQKKEVENITTGEKEEAGEISLKSKIIIGIAAAAIVLAVIIVYLVRKYRFYKLSKRVKIRKGRQINVC
jgi:hypothetical protein